MCRSTMLYAAHRLRAQGAGYQRLCGPRSSSNSSAGLQHRMRWA